MIIQKLKHINTEKTTILPSSKSYLNRALIVASYKSGITTLTNITDICDDVRDLINALTKLGVKITINEQKGEIVVIGTGGKFCCPENGEINCGLGGTTTRFLIGLSLLFNFDVKITAIGKMLERPVNNLLDVISKLGKNVKYLQKPDCLPIEISKTNGLKTPNEIEIDCSKSSQFLSAVLLIASQIGLKKIVAKKLVSRPYIDITIDVLRQYGIEVKTTQNGEDLICEVVENHNTTNTNRQIEVETDWSSASYFLALEKLHNIKLKTNLTNKTSSQGDSKIVEILAQIENFDGDELVIDMKSMPDVSMTAMVVCVLKNFNTTITGLETLKNKECDRLKAMHDELEKCGVKTEISQNYDAITIYGKGEFELKNSVKISTYHDHRIAMCFAVLGTKIGNLKIENPDVVKKSFPNFWLELNKLY